MGKTDNNLDQVTDHPVLLFDLCCVCVCVHVWATPVSYSTQKATSEATEATTDLILIVFQLHHLETSCKTTTVHLCSVKMVNIYDQFQQWSPPASPIQGSFQRWCNLAVNQLNGLSIHSNCSLHNNCNQRIPSCQNRNLSMLFFLLCWWTLKPNWHGEDISTHQWQACIRPTCHYLHSFPVWPAIIPSWLRLRRD